MEFELTRSDYLIQDYIAKMGGATDAQLGAWLRPTEAERLALLAFIDAELARREAAEKQPRLADTLRPYRLSLKQLAKLRTHREGMSHPNLAPQAPIGSPEWRPQHPRKEHT
jgi:hypothetical protein